MINADDARNLSEEGHALAMLEAESRFPAWMPSIMATIQHESQKGNVSATVAIVDSPGVWRRLFGKTWSQEQDRVLQYVLASELRKLGYEVQTEVEPGYSYLRKGNYITISWSIMTGGTK